MKKDFITDFKKNNTCKTLIIAEAGVHHDCSITRAKTLIDAAADAGADIIKFQSYKAETLVTNWAPVYWQQNESTDSDSTQYEYFKKRDRFGAKDFKVLFDYSRENGIFFCSTPFDIASIDLLEDMGVPLWKVASGDIDNYPLLERMSRTGKPVLLSTGASYFDEISTTVKFLAGNGVERIALLHCNLAYPTSDENANLPRIGELKKRFPELIIGYSDHTIPDPCVTIPTIAVALGAKIVEKHFTLDRTLPEDDHLHSADPALLKKMIANIAIVEKAVCSNFEITDSEIPARNYARRSLVASGNISPGSFLTRKNIIPKRPGNGISPKFFNSVIGKKTKIGLKRDQQLTWDILE